MSAGRPDRQPDAAAGPEGTGPAGSESGPGPFDAAEAAGFGGITWADEAGGDHAEKPGQAADGVSEESKGGNGPGAKGSDSTGPDSTGPGSNGGSPPAEPDGATAESGAGAPGDAPPSDISVEALVQDLERVTAERDQYLDASRRLQAELENYRKAVAKREKEARERANESLISEILPVLDACDGAMASGATDVEPVRTSLMDALTKQGLGRIDEEEAPFDPERHEAVMHDPDEDGDGPVVAEVMRAGYSWKGRVVRPAMVRVRG